MRTTSGLPWARITAGPLAYGPERVTESRNARAGRSLGDLRASVPLYKAEIGLWSSRDIISWEDAQSRILGHDGDEVVPRLSVPSPQMGSP
jgi:hypothetical protein